MATSEGNGFWNLVSRIQKEVGNLGAKAWNAYGHLLKNRAADLHISLDAAARNGGKNGHFYGSGNDPGTSHHQGIAAALTKALNEPDWTGHINDNASGRVGAGKIQFNIGSERFGRSALGGGGGHHGDHHSLRHQYAVAEPKTQSHRHHADNATRVTRATHPERGGPS